MLQVSKSKIISIIKKIEPKNIMVIGDLMLDQYIWGKVERISPEGPIPVLRVDKEEFRLGGAANAAVNVKHLLADVFPVGLVGADNSGDKILEIFQAEGISTKGIVQFEGFQTIVKQRAITEQQQLLRIDYEKPQVENLKMQEKIVSRVKQYLPEMHCVILSDYAKGVLRQELIKEVIQTARELGIPVICDPGKGVDFSCYSGITAIKPNRMETEQATGIILNGRDSVLSAAQKLKETVKADFVTVSLDKDGILFYKNQEEFQFIDANVPEVHDVTGAGDMMISAISVLLANRISPLESTYIANIAAGLETSHLGVVPIPWPEILKNITDEGLGNKIITLEELVRELDNRQTEPLIFTNGYFDNVSAGHLRFLLEIEKFNGRLVVAINSDDSIQRQKNSFPLLKQQDRARILASIENVHRVIIFDEDDASELIRELKPNLVIKGETFKGEDISEAEAIDEVNAVIEYIPHFAW